MLLDGTCSNMYSQSGDKWEDQYNFAEVESLPGDFDIMDWAVATQPTSYFDNVRHTPPVRDILSFLEQRHALYE